MSTWPWRAELSPVSLNKRKCLTLPGRKWVQALRTRVEGHSSFVEGALMCSYDAQLSVCPIKKQGLWGLSLGGYWPEPLHRPEGVMNSEDSACTDTQTPCKPLLSQPLHQLSKELNLNISFKGGLNYLQFCIKAMLCLKAQVSMRVVQTLFLLLQTKEPLISNEWLHLPSMLSCLNMEILVSICFHYPKKEELLFQFFSPWILIGRRKKTSGCGQFFIFPRKMTSVCATLALLLQQKYSFRIFWWCPPRGHHHQLFSRCFSLS